MRKPALQWIPPHPLTANFKDILQVLKVNVGSLWPQRSRLRMPGSVLFTSSLETIQCWRGRASLHLLGFYVGLTSYTLSFREHSLRTSESPPVTVPGITQIVQGLDILGQRDHSLFPLYLETQSCYILLPGLELGTLLQPSECSDYIHVPPSLLPIWQRRKSNFGEIKQLLFRSKSLKPA